MLQPKYMSALNAVTPQTIANNDLVLVETSSETKKMTYDDLKSAIINGKPTAVSLTQTQYDNLSSADKLDITKIYFTPNNIYYAGAGYSGTPNFVFSTYSQMEAAIQSGSVPNGSVCYISTTEYTNPSAGNVTYSNSSSGLTATDVQSAIDELTQRIASLE